ncbi:Photosystem I P700 chlorophyll a apoprotein A1-like protein [Drosera capensis]
MRNQSLSSNPITAVAVSAGKWSRPTASRDFSALYRGRLAYDEDLTKISCYPWNECSVAPAFRCRVEQRMKSVNLAHNKLKVAPATQPRALSIVQGHAVGVAQYLLGGIATTWAFFLARIMGVGEMLRT